jgi:hypothetical protein
MISRKTIEIEIFEQFNFENLSGVFTYVAIKANSIRQ